jgi:hypothetical protein
MLYIFLLYHIVSSRMALPIRCMLIPIYSSPLSHYTCNWCKSLSAARIGVTLLSIRLIYFMIPAALDLPVGHSDHIRASFAVISRMRSNLLMLAECPAIGKALRTHAGMLIWGQLVIAHPVVSSPPGKESSPLQGDRLDSRLRGNDRTSRE